MSCLDCGGFEMAQVMPVVSRIAVGDTAALVLTLTNGSGRRLPSMVTWTSTRPEVASIEAAVPVSRPAMLRAHAAGETVLTARLTGTGGESHIVVLPLTVTARP
ncbi:hypothetical protein [Roseisolibacter agri]|uniref:hypothetical protein n=1 Tax=Roseisolibacter agri TaxID=2014610 RepID=UPI0024E061B3|nr:hypothetical protein [Roseisolibacter agri]